MWKRFIGAASVIVAVIFMLPVLPAYADTQLYEGDTIEYIFSVGESKNVAGIAVDSFYNSNLLTLAEEPKFVIGSGMVNSQNAGRIRWSIMINGGRAFSDDDLFIETFTVNKACTLEELAFSFNCTEIFDDSLNSLQTSLISAHVNILGDQTDRDVSEPVSSSEPENSSSEEPASSEPISDIETDSDTQSDTVHEVESDSVSSVKPVIITTTDLTASDDDDDSSSSAVVSRKTVVSKPITSSRTNSSSSSTSSKASMSSSSTSSKASTSSSSTSSKASTSSSSTRSKASTSSSSTSSKASTSSSSVSSQESTIDSSVSSQIITITPSVSSQKSSITASAGSTSVISPKTASAGGIVVVIGILVLVAAGITALITKRNSERSE